MKKRSAAIALAGFTAFAGCGEGDKWDYPSLTPEIKYSLEKRVGELVDSDAVIVGDMDQCPTDKACDLFENTTKEFLFYSIQMRIDDATKKGYSMESLQDISVEIFSKDEISTICSGNIGCYNEGTIYLDNTNNFLDFVRLFSHEFGHHQFSPGAEEFAPQANMVYAPFKEYQFSKPTGSFLTLSSMYYMPYLQLDELSSKDRMYADGHLFSLLNLDWADGDIEQAFDRLTHRRIQLNEQDLMDAAKKYPGLNIDELSIAFWGDLLKDPGLVTEFGTGFYPMGADAAEEYLDYLQLEIFRRKFPEEVWAESPNEAQDTYRDMLWDFINKHADKNPFFAGDTAALLTSNLFKYLSRTKSQPTILDERFSLAKEIIDLNKEYPCDTADFEFPAYECPKQLRPIRSEHVYAYKALSLAAYDLNDLDKSIIAARYAHDFIVKFYQGKLAGVEQKETNNYVPFITYYPALSLVDNRTDMDFAKELLNMALEVECLKAKDTPGSSYDKCIIVQSFSQSLLDWMKKKGY